MNGASRFLRRDRAEHCRAAAHETGARAVVAMASKDASDKGQIIELGWLSFRKVIHPNAPPVQLTEMRTAFYAGAQHLSRAS